MVIGQLLLEAILGGLTGYVTNDVAIKGLFKEGGVVQQTREEFTRAASQLLEKKIITAEVLNQRVHLPAVAQAIDQFVQQFLLTDLPAVLAKHQLDHLPEAPSIGQQLEDHLLEIWQREQAHLIAIITDQIALHYLIDQPQIDHVRQQLQACLSEQLVDGKIVTRWMTKVIDNSQTTTLEQLGLAPMFTMVMDNVQSILWQWLNLVQVDYEIQLENLLTETMVRLELPYIFMQMEHELKGRSLQEFILIDGEQIATELVALVGSSKGQALLGQLADDLVTVLGTLDIPLDNLLSADMVGRLMPVLKQWLPEIMESLVKWLNENQQLLNQMVEDAIDETFGEAEGIKGLVLQLIKETILRDAAQEYGLVDQMGELLSANASSDETIEALMTIANTFIANHTVADMVQKMAHHQALIVQMIKALIESNILYFLQHHGAQTIDQQLQKPLERWFSGSLMAQHSMTVVQAIAQYLVSQLSSPVIKQQLQQRLETIEKRLLTQPLAEQGMIHQDSAQQWAITVQGWVTQGIKAVDFPLEKWLGQVDLVAILQQWLPTMTDYGQEQFQKHWSALQQKPLDSMVSKVLNPSVVAHWTPSATGFIQDKIVNVANLHLGQLAQQSLNRLSNEEILVLVQNFMGRELKPLNYLGAALGGVVGLATGGLFVSTTGSMMLAGTGGAMAMLVGKTVIFGLVGYGTNCAAIKGLFWPYKPVLGIRSLQGVIPKQQATFADSLGKMVESYVLNETILQEVLVGQNEHWMAKGTVLGQNPVVLQDVIRKIGEQAPTISQESYRIIRERVSRYLPLACATLGQSSINQWFSLSLDQFDDQWLEEKVAEQGKRYLTQLCHAKGKVGQYVSAAQLIQQLLGSQGITLAVSGEVFKDFWLKENRRYHQWQQQSLNQVLSEQMSQQGAGLLGNNLNRWLSSEQFAVDLANGCNRFLQANRVDEALGGGINLWVEKNIASLLQIMINHLIQQMTNQKGHIAEKVQSEIKERLNFMQHIGYKMMDGDQLVEEVVNRLIEVKIPIFLGMKQHEIKQVVMTYWDQHIASASFGQLNIQVSSDQVALVRDKLLDAPEVVKVLNYLVDQIWQWINGVPMANYLQHTVFRDAHSGSDALAKPLDDLGQWLNQHWQLAQQPITDKAVQLLTPIIQDQLDSTPLAQVFEHIDSERVDAIQWHSIIQMGQGYQLSQQYRADLAERLAQMRLEQWFDWPALSRNVIRECHVVVSSNVAQHWWERLINHELAGLENTVYAIVPQASREMIIGWVVEGFLNSLYHHGANILAPMDLAQLTSQQVQAMDAEELEALVRSFSAQYFSHIQNMGWMGAAFALPGSAIQYLFGIL